MAKKVQRSVNLSAFLWAQVEDLIGAYGDGQNEVLTHVLTDWFSKNQDQITSRKKQVEGLRGEIEAIQKRESQ